jgi:hypothetical protein
MHCETAQEHFSDYISQELDRAMALSLENHLSSCERCREEVATLRRAWAALDEMPVVDPPMFFHENLMSRLAAQQGQVEEATASRRALWDWRALFRPRQLAFGAVALVILLAGAEVVQTQRAALGPVGWVLSLLRPAPSKESAPKAEAVWTAAPQNGIASGTLTVTLTPAPNTPGDGLNYTLTVNGNTGTAKSGVLTREAAIETFTLSQAPTALTLTFGDVENQKSVNLSIKPSSDP